MSPTDRADVSASTYTYLVNGNTPAGNWTGIYAPGERIRLRFINAGAMTYFDVRIPGLPMTVVAADGQYVEPVAVDEFRIGSCRDTGCDRDTGGRAGVHVVCTVHGSIRLRTRHAGDLARNAGGGAPT